MYLGVHTHTHPPHIHIHTNVTTINEKEAINLKERKGDWWTIWSDERGEENDALFYGIKR